MESEDESRLTTIREKTDNRSDFDRAFDDDTLYQLQERMLAKAKTKKFTAEDFVERAKHAYETELEVEEEPAPTKETPEPEEEEPFSFF